jgi:hypothetical protein
MKNITSWKTPIIGVIRIILCKNLNCAYESILLSILLQYKVNTIDGDRRRSWYSSAEELNCFRY